VPRTEIAAGPAAGGSLAEAIAQGPLPLATALAYGKDIASSVSLLHQQGLVCGAIHADGLRCGPAGVELPAPSALYRHATPEGDLHDFGVLLHRLLTGSAPDGTVPAGNPVDGEMGPEAIRAAALRVAYCCRGGSGGEIPEMRRVATELRLLSLMAGNPGEAVRETAHEIPLVAEEAPAGREQAKADRGPHLEPAPSGVICPRCGAPHVNPSRRHGLLEFLLAWSGSVKRCHRCTYRFLTLFGMHIDRSKA